MSQTRPIIIIKKKAGHGGHHGGAWKVAYADFVTAMMALFIVLWLLNTSKPVKEAIAGYFKDPAGTADKIGSSKTGAAENFTLTKDDMPKLKQELEKAIRSVTNFDKIKNQIEITVTSEGLRIELLETETGTFFDLGSSEPNSNGKELLVLLAQELGKLPNRVSIEGHTDSKPYGGKTNYGNWELSADRANAARRLMQQNGLGLNRYRRFGAMPINFRARRTTRKTPRTAASRSSCRIWNRLPARQRKAPEKKKKKSHSGRQNRNESVNPGASRPARSLHIDTSATAS